MISIIAAIANDQYYPGNKIIRRIKERWYIDIFFEKYSFLEIVFSPISFKFLRNEK